MARSYLADVVTLQPPRQSRAATVLDWLKAAMAGRRAAAARRRNAALLREMDPQILDDIGLGAMSPGQAPVQWLDLMPHAVAVRLLVGSPPGKI